MKWVNIYLINHFLKFANRFGFGLWTTWEFISLNKGFTTSGAAHPPEYTIEQMDNMITALADNGDLRNGYRVTFPIRAIYAGKVLRFQVKVLKQKASAIDNFYITF